MGFTFLNTVSLFCWAWFTFCFMSVCVVLSNNHVSYQNWDRSLPQCGAKFCPSMDQNLPSVWSKILPQYGSEICPNVEQNAAVGQDYAPVWDIILPQCKSWFRRVFLVTVDGTFDALWFCISLFDLKFFFFNLTVSLSLFVLKKRVKIYRVVLL